MSNYIRILGFILSGFILVSCQGLKPFSKPKVPLPRPLGNTLPTPITNDPEKKKGESAAPSFSEALVLEKALALALLKNPKLSVFSWELRARDANILQAGVFPNPELTVDVENVIGTGDLSGMDQAETTLSIGQRFETAGKRRKRETLAALNRDLAGWDYEALRLTLFTEVSQNFTEVLGDQKKVVLFKALLRLAEQVAEAVEKRVDAGKVSPFEAVKAKVALSSAKIDLSRVEKELIASRKALAAMWGSPDPEFKFVQGRLSPQGTLPSFKALLDRLPQHPALARWEAELSQREAVIELEKAKSIPDLIFSGGFRQFNETDDHALVAGISIDLPVFNRNQGSVLEAQAHYSKALAARDAAFLNLKTELVQAYRFLSTTFFEVEGLKNDLLPVAEMAFEAASEGYRLGKFNLLDVLDAQRTLAHARVQYLQAQIDHHKAVAVVEGFIGEKMTNSASEKSSRQEGD